MKFIPLGQSDARLIELVVRVDERGSFTRTWCADSFAAQGIDFRPVQGNNSVTRVRGSVRGMHFQAAPKADAKIVRCTAGRIHDVIVDIRPTSPTRGQVYANELAPDLPTSLTASRPWRMTRWSSISWALNTSRICRTDFATTTP